MRAIHLASLLCKKGVGLSKARDVILGHQSEIENMYRGDMAPDRIATELLKYAK